VDSVGSNVVRLRYKHTKKNLNTDTTACVGITAVGGKQQGASCVRAHRSKCSSTESARCHPLNLYKQ